MSLADSVLAVNDDLPIRTDLPVHSGKVRSVYWLTAADSRRLIEEKGYDVAADAPLAIMVISDRISAFDCIWHGEEGLQGVPGKGAALNAISNHWFKLFKEQGLADSHILDIPHPFVWIVQKAKPVMIEAIKHPQHKKIPKFKNLILISVSNLKPLLKIFKKNNKFFI